MATGPMRCLPTIASPSERRPFRYKEARLVRASFVSAFRQSLSVPECDDSATSGLSFRQGSARGKFVHFPPQTESTGVARNGGGCFRWWCQEFHMSLWGENSVLIAMTSVAFGERANCLEGKLEGSRSIAPVLPEIQSSLSFMQTTRTAGSGDGSSDRRTGSEPSIHRLDIFWKSGAVELAAQAGRGF